MIVRSFPRIVVALTLALLSMGLIASGSASAAEAPLVQPTLIQFMQTPSAKAAKAFTANVKKRKRASTSQIDALNQRKNELGANLATEISSRYDARNNHLKSWLPTYRATLLAPAQKAYSDGLKEATQVYTKTVKKARKGTKADVKEITRTYRRKVAAIYAQVQKKLNKARKVVKKRARRVCKRTTPRHTTARRNCIRAAKRKKLSAVRRDQIIASFDKQLSAAQRARDAKLEKIDDRVEKVEEHASAVLVKKQKQLQATLNKAKAEANKKIAAAKAANHDYYDYLRRKETQQATGLKKRMRKAVMALRARS